SLARERRAALSLTGDGAVLTQRLVVLEAVTGAAPILGPGLRVTLDDARGERAGGGADPRQGEDAEDGRVLDYDLQRLVNALWESGAEAVSVNGQRVTALTAIRLAGEAIVVGYRPLAPPYVVDAIGDPAALEPALADSAGGRYLRGLVKNYGIGLEVAPRRRLELPAAAGLRLTAARALPREDAATGQREAR
ncbi:MAG: DUF881 domain-containing protein, partial [Actinomycetota bacterium]|nr:DUF881 domain-containing protein [Actinomycetota bacterium]